MRSNQSILVLPLFIFLFSVATAQESRPRVQGSESSDNKVLISAGRLQGATVVDRMGEDVGTVSSIVLTVDAKGVYLVASVGGIVGVGSKKIAIPMQAMHLRPDDDKDAETAWLAVNVSAETLKKAPQLEARDRLELSDPDWNEKNATYFGLENRVVKATPTLLVSDLINAKVAGKAEETLAYLDDIIFGFDADPIKYAILGYGGALGIGKDYVAIPFSELQIGQDGNEKPTIATRFDAKTLAEQQRVTPSSYPELKLSSVRRRIEK